MLGLLRGFSKVIILFIWPYSCWFCRICWANADRGSVCIWCAPENVFPSVGSFGLHRISCVRHVKRLQKVPAMQTGGTPTMCPSTLPFAIWRDPCLSYKNSDSSVQWHLVVPKEKILRSLVESSLSRSCLYLIPSLQRPINSQLIWAILLCDVIPDGKTE